jgi:hypothetical protein
MSNTLLFEVTERPTSRLPVVQRTPHTFDHRPVLGVHGHDQIAMTRST